MDAPVLLPACFVRFGALRAFFPVTDCDQPVAGDAKLAQKVLGSRSTPVTQSEVVLCRPTLVTVALDDHSCIWEVAHNGFQSVGILCQRRLGVLTKVAPIKIEERVLHFIA